jgi:hypothetical protein
MYADTEITLVYFNQDTHSFALTLVENISGSDWLGTEFEICIRLTSQAVGDTTS